MVLILTQDRCMVCAEHTIGSEIILEAPDGTPSGRGSYRISFRNIWRLLASVQDRCTVGAEQTIGLEIVLVAPDGTPW